MVPVFLLHGGDFSMKTLLTAVAFVAFAISPASAALEACTTANMAKTVAAMGGADTPAKIATRKEMALANTDMSKGNMRGACSHYMKAQKAMASK
jgi:IMP dehydrogenase/GMP reductase